MTRRSPREREARGARGDPVRDGELRDPTTSPARAQALAASTPEILYVQANVHGGEESGTESSLRLLY